MNYLEFASRFLLLWSWQALLLLAATGLVRRFDRSGAPALRHSLWLAGLTAVVVLPVWNAVWMLLPAAESQPSSAPFTVVRLVVSPITTESVSAADPQAAPKHTLYASKTQVLLVFLFVSWVAGFCICLARIGHSYRTLQRLRRNAAPVEWPRDFGDSYGAVLAISSEVDSPFVAGIRHPMIVLPACTAEWMTDDERVAVIRHEAAHIQRRDHVVNVLQMLLGAVFFFHPVVRYALRQLTLERELACDCHVVNSGYKPELYANAILKVAQHVVKQRYSQQPAFNSSRKVLERRLHMILEKRTPVSKARRIAILARALVVLISMTWLLLPQPVATAAREPITLLPSFVAPVVAPVAPTTTPEPAPARKAPTTPAVKKGLVQAKAPEQVLLSGRLSGSISDPTGALVPGAKITLKKDSGMEQSAFSNEVGMYDFSQMQPGFYEMLVTMAGFQTFKMTSVRVGQGESQQMNVNLHVAPLAQAVEVSVSRMPAAAPAPQAPATRKRISSGVISAALMSRPNLIYPPGARAEGRGGVVVVEIIIGKDGTVTEARVMARPDADLAEAALENVRQWRYRPTMLNGEPIETIATVSVNFQIQ